MLPECSSTEDEYLVINLSDDVEIDSILVSNREDFSADFKEIMLLGTTDFPPPKNDWIYIGSIKPNKSNVDG